MSAEPASLLGPVREPFRAMTEAFVPEATELEEDAWDRLEETVEEGLARRPPDIHRQIRLFLKLANWMALPRYGRPLTALPPSRRRSFLKGLERAPILLLRRGLWGVRTLSFMGYYGLPEVREEIGYRARPDGWGARAGGEPDGETRGESGEDDGRPRTHDDPRADR